MAKYITHTHPVDPMGDPCHGGCPVGCDYCTDPELGTLVLCGHSVDPSGMVICKHYRRQKHVVPPVAKRAMIGLLGLAGALELIAVMVSHGPAPQPRVDPARNVAAAHQSTAAATSSTDWAAQTSQLSGSAQFTSSGAVCPGYAPQGNYKVAIILNHSAMTLSIDGATPATGSIQPDGTFTLQNEFYDARGQISGDAHLKGTVTYRDGGTSCRYTVAGGVAGG